MKVLYYILGSTILYAVALCFTMLRIYIDVGEIPLIAWVVSGIIYIAMLPVVSIFLYMTENLQRKGVIR